MNAKRSLTIVLILGLAAGLAAAACGGGDDGSSSPTPGAGSASSPSSGGGSNQLCNDLTQLRSSLSTVATSGSPDELKSNLSGVKSSLDDVKRDAAQVKDANSGDLESSYNNLEDAVQGISSDSSIREMVSAIATPLGEFVDALQQLGSQVKC